MAKTVDPVKEKERKQKIFVAVAGSALLILLAIVGPGTWRALNPKAAQPTTAQPAAAPAAATAYAAPASSPTGALASSPVAGATTAASLPTSGPPAPGEGQLVSFARFRGKDPFRPQIRSIVKTPSADSAPVVAPTPSAAVRSPAAAPVAPPLAPAPAPARSRTATTRVGATTRPATQSGTPRVAASVLKQSARIMVNGTPQTVSDGGSFPRSRPIFELAALRTNAAEISIDGGTFANGARTVTLRLGKPLTLMNTATGTRYVLVLTATSSS